MNKALIAMGFTIMLFLVGCSGCIDQNSESEISGDTNLVSGDTHLVGIVTHNVRKNTTINDYDFWEVYGTMKNIAKKNFDVIDIMVYFYDSDDTLLYSDSTFNSLGENQTDNFSIAFPDYLEHYENFDNYKIVISVYEN